MTFQQTMQGQQLSELQQLVQASGKMVLLDKLLPKLRAEGHKVARPPVSHPHTTKPAHLFCDRLHLNYLPHKPT